ncbi:hypothetical protein AFB00_30310 (plasmid) [Pseudonocardia sp. HH130630-07]|nr:hypothetical protein AFB00_30310 [Pseudonocardia sp. HH130630-07]
MSSRAWAPSRGRRLLRLEGGSRFATSDRLDRARLGRVVVEQLAHHPERGPPGLRWEGVQLDSTRLDQQRQRIQAVGPAELRYRARSRGRAELRDSRGTVGG